MVLAGGRGARLGGGKAAVELAGKPLVSYPLGALSSALTEVVVVAKTDTELPSLPGVTVWIEPPAPRHPLAGIVHALGLAEGRPVFVCAGDMPFVTTELVRRFAEAQLGLAQAAIAKHENSAQPLLGVYRPLAAHVLGRGAAEGASVNETVVRLGPKFVEVEDPDELFNVNTPDDLLQAAAILDRRARRVPWAPH